MGAFWTSDLIGTQVAWMVQATPLKGRHHGLELRPGRGVGLVSIGVLSLFSSLFPLQNVAYERRTTVDTNAKNSSTPM